MVKRLVSTPDVPELDDAWLVDPALIVHSSPTAILAVAIDGRVLTCNPAVEALLGYTADEVIDSNLDFLLPGFRDGLELDNPVLVETSPAVPCCCLVARRKDGVPLAVEVTAGLVEAARGNLLIVSHSDAEARAGREADQAELMIEIETQQERNRIGMDLHDGIMQEVYAIGLTLENALFEVDEKQTVARREVERAITQLHDVIGNIRSYIFDLRPRDFDGDLKTALGNLAHEFQQNSRIQTYWDVCDAVSQIEPDRALALYSIAHESLSNVRKHAQARNVSMKVCLCEGTLLFEVADDGCGFEAGGSLPERHRGMRNMASRARNIGGTLEVESRRHEGTVVRVRITLQAGARFRAA